MDVQLYIPSEHYTLGNLHTYGIALHFYSIYKYYCAHLIILQFSTIIHYISHGLLFDTFYVILILPYIHTDVLILPFYVNLCAIDLPALSICISCFVYIGIAREAPEALLVVPFLPSFFMYEVIRELLFYIHIHTYMYM